MRLYENYQWAVISNKSDKYLWILCRTTQRNDCLNNEILKMFISKERDLNKRLKVEQILN